MKIKIEERMEERVVWEDVFAKQMKAFPLILCSLLIREKKRAATDDQKKGWDKKKGRKDGV